MLSGPTRLGSVLQDIGGDVVASLEELPLPAVLLDRDGIVRWQNRASQLRIGDQAGGRFYDLVAAATEPKVKKRLIDAVRHGKPSELRFRVNLADGSAELRELSTAPVRSGGCVVGVFGISTQINANVTSFAPTSHPDLTNRQVSVLRLLAVGMTTPEIAAELEISENTVRNHIAHLITALGVRTRLQAVIAGARAGLLG